MPEACRAKRSAISENVKLIENPIRIDAIVKKSLESVYPGPESPAVRPIHGFATAISKAFSRRSPTSLT
jgi:hypothetical protein